jgi:hypothetical protein
VPNVNVPKSLGVVMPRQILEDWSAIGFDPWSAGKQLRTTTLVSDLSALERKTVPEEEERVSGARVLGESVGTCSCPCPSHTPVPAPALPDRVLHVSCARVGQLNLCVRFPGGVCVLCSRCGGSCCQLPTVQGAGAAGAPVLSVQARQVHRDRRGTPVFQA